MAKAFDIVKGKDGKQIRNFLPVAREPEYLSTGVMILNLCFSGNPLGGIKKGIVSQISADSSLGKSIIGLLLLKEAIRKGMDAFVIDTERTFDYRTAEAMGIDTENLPILQTSNIAEIEHILETMKDNKTREECYNTFCLFDSWGTLLSPDNMGHALANKETKVMSLPVWKNELANLLHETGITTFVVNHIVTNTGGFGDPTSVAGGKRLYYISNGIVMCNGTGSKYKVGDEILGKIVQCCVKKGRDAVEFVKAEYMISHYGGLNPFYGLLDDAVGCGLITSPSAGYYTRPDYDTDGKKYREKDLYTMENGIEFWKPILKDEVFLDFCKKKYTFVDREFFTKENDVNAIFDL